MELSPLVLEMVALIFDVIESIGCHIRHAKSRWNLLLRCVQFGSLISLTMFSKLCCLHPLVRRVKDRGGV